jgi:membrane protease subunit (stomatin/prohibitin family)
VEGGRIEVVIGTFLFVLDFGRGGIEMPRPFGPGPRPGPRPARRVARGAVVGGAGYAIGKKKGRKAEEAEAETAYQQQQIDTGAVQQQPTQQRPAASSEEDTIEQLKKLGELRDSGVLTEEEFQKEKRKILGG